ncbi:MAG: hypothetical protein WC405_10980 [Syntrophales bacterium]
MKIRALLRRFQVDRAVFFGLLTRVWGLCAGPVTAILIATKFSPELQGYYYTFATILALQVFVELGLGTVIVQFASHEWSKLEMDPSGHISGDGDALSRLVSIANIAARWYLIGAILVIIGLGIGGYVFFSGSPSFMINWPLPWFLLCLTTGMTICLVPVWSMLEGCNQVARLYTFRFFQGAITTITVWVAILSGAELWTASISGIVAFLCSVFFLKRSYWYFLKTFFLSKPGGARIQWRTDMLPMQWRMAVSWISGYFCFSLFIPVLFKFHGPVVAGQMGMTWSIVGMMGAISGSWLSPRVPVFGMLVAQKKYDELDRQFWQVLKIVAGITAFLALLIWCFVFMLNILDYKIAVRFASRMIPPLPTGLFLLAQFILIALMPFANYLRAHKKEPLMLMSIISALLIGLSTVTLGKYYSVTGMALGYLFLNIMLVPIVFLIWYRCRKVWHAQ